MSPQRSKINNKQPQLRKLFEHRGLHGLFEESNAKKSANHTHIQSALEIYDKYAHDQRQNFPRAPNLRFPFDFVSKEVQRRTDWSFSLFREFGRIIAHLRSRQHYEILQASFGDRLQRLSRDKRKLDTAMVHQVFLDAASKFRATAMTPNSMDPGDTAIRFLQPTGAIPESVRTSAGCRGRSAVVTFQAEDSRPGRSASILRAARHDPVDDFSTLQTQVHKSGPADPREKATTPIENYQMPTRLKITIGKGRRTSRGPVETQSRAKAARKRITKRGKLSEAQSELARSPTPELDVETTRPYSPRPQYGGPSPANLNAWYQSRHTSVWAQTENGYSSLFASAPLQQTSDWPTPRSKASAPDHPFVTDNQNEERARNMRTEAGSMQWDNDLEDINMECADSLKDQGTDLAGRWGGADHIGPIEESEDIAEESDRQAQAICASYSAPVCPPSYSRSEAASRKQTCLGLATPQQSPEALIDEGSNCFHKMRSVSLPSPRSGNMDTKELSPGTEHAMSGLQKILCERNIDKTVTKLAQKALQALHDAQESAVSASNQVTPSVQTLSESEDAFELYCGMPDFLTLVSIAAQDFKLQTDLLAQRTSWMYHMILIHVETLKRAEEVIKQSSQAIDRTRNEPIQSSPKAVSINSPQHCLEVMARIFKDGRVEMETMSSSIHATSTPAPQASACVTLHERYPNLFNQAQRAIEDLNHHEHAEWLAQARKDQQQAAEFIGLCLVRLEWQAVIAGGGLVI